MPEQEALLLARLTRSADGESALEQAWLLRELRERFQLSLDELARRFGRGSSWVSRRLGLVKELPEAIQELVRRGLLVPHAAMKHLLPLARANPAGAVADPAVDLLAFGTQSPADLATAVEGPFQVDLVDALHQRKFLGIMAHRLVIEP